MIKYITPMDIISDRDAIASVVDGLAVIMYDGEEWDGLFRRAGGFFLSRENGEEKEVRKDSQLKLIYVVG